MCAAPCAASIRTPTLVIHGTEDPLVPVAAGQATADAIPGAKLHLIDGLGHELPAGSWPIIADALAPALRDALAEKWERFAVLDLTCGGVFLWACNRPAPRTPKGSSSSSLRSR